MMYSFLYRYILIQILFGKSSEIFEVLKMARKFTTLYMVISSLITLFLFIAYINEEKKMHVYERHIQFLTGIILYCFMKFVVISLCILYY